MSKWDPGFFLFFAQVVGLDTARIKTFPSRVLKKLLKILDKEDTVASNHRSSVTEFSFCI